MATVNNLKPMLHRKAWELCTNIPVVFADGAFLVGHSGGDPSLRDCVFLVNGASDIWQYSPNEDGWKQAPSATITGAFAAGACGEFIDLSAPGGAVTLTARVAGTTTRIPTSINSGRNILDARVRVVAGTGVGHEGKVGSSDIGPNCNLEVFPASSVAFDTTTQFQVFAGSLWFFNSGTTAVGFSVYDRWTGVWTARSVTGLPTAWGTVGQLVSTQGDVFIGATGTATAGSATGIQDSTKSWANSAWVNFQVRITGGKGKGQIRAITASNATGLSVASWAVQPDNTSTYSIEGNDDYLYLTGNNATPFYRYQISTNTWTTLAARAGAAASGSTADWVTGVHDARWQHSHDPANLRQNGRFILSFRAGGTSTMDVYDIAANTWQSGAPYGGRQEVFGSGTCAYACSNGDIIVQKDATSRFYRYVAKENELAGIGQHLFPPGSTRQGDKHIVLDYVDGSTTIRFLYSALHSQQYWVRMLLVE